MNKVPAYIWMVTFKNLFSLYVVFSWLLLSTPHLYDFMQSGNRQLLDHWCLSYHKNSLPRHLLDLDYYWVLESISCTIISQKKCQLFNS